MRTQRTQRSGKIGHPSTGSWIIALPAWGKRYVDVLVEKTLPALNIALQELGKPVRLFLWTDEPARVVPNVSPTCQVTLSSPPGPDGAFQSLSNCHRQALEAAGPQDRALLLTADMVVSRELLVTAERLVGAGVCCVCCVAPRVLEDALDCPVGGSGRQLLEWAWKHRHPMTRECTWPDGRSYDVWRMYFETGDEVAARVFLPHPLVVVTHGRRLTFSPTIDVNLSANYSPSVTYLVTSPEEGAVVELSPANKEFVMTETMMTRFKGGGPSVPTFVPVTIARHRMFYSKRVIIRGHGDVDDHAVVERVLR